MLQFVKQQRLLLLSKQTEKERRIRNMIAATTRGLAIGSALLVIGLSLAKALGFHV